MECTKMPTGQKKQKEDEGKKTADDRSFSGCACLGIYLIVLHPHTHTKLAISLRTFLACSIPLLDKCLCVHKNANLMRRLYESNCM